MATLAPTAPVPMMPTRAGRDMRVVLPTFATLRRSVGRVEAAVSTDQSARVGLTVGAGRLSGGSGAYLGEAGFQDMRRDMTPSIEGLPEAGWSLVAAAHGRGLATEAVRAMLAWADGNLDFVRTVCIIDDGNAASLRLASQMRAEWRQRRRRSRLETMTFGIW